MNKENDKTKEQLIAELTELRKKSKEQLEKLSAANQQLNAGNQQMQATEQQLRAANQQLEASNKQLIASEQELKKEKIFSEKIVETANAIIVGLDKDHIIRIFNRGAEQITGYKKEEVIGKDWFKIFFPKEMLDEMNKVWKDSWGIKSHSYINPILAKTGEEKIVSWQTTGMYDSDDVSKHLVLSIGEDITKRKQVEEKLQESETRFRRLAETTSVMIMIYQNDYFIYANPAVEMITGYRFDELKQRKIWTIVSHEYVNLTKERGQMRQRGESVPSGYEFKIITKQGKEKWVFLTGNTLELNNGKAGLITATDITERKRAEEALKTSLQQIEVINANTPNIIWKSDIDKQGNFINTYISEVVDEFLALPKGTINNSWDKYFSYIIPDYLPQINELFKKGIANPGELFSFSYEVKKADGKKAWFTSSGKIRVENNKLTVYGSTSDITERKQAEEKLKESEETYRNLFNNAQVGLFRTRIEDGKILESNEQLAHMFGYKNRNEFINKYKTSENYVDPGTREKMLEIIIEKGEINNYEVQFYRKDRSIYWANYSAKVYPEKGWIEGVAEDITQRKQAEIELTKLSTAVKQSPSVIAITDTEGNIEYVNPKFSEITGYSLDEAIGQNPRVLKSGEQSDKMYKELWETVSTGKVWHGEFHNKKKNEELFWEMASISPIFDKQGKIINYIKVAEDITERKQAEGNFKHSIDESPLGIRIVTQSGKTIYVNKALLGIYEFSSLDEFNNTKAIDRYTELSYKEHQERKKIRQAGGDASEYEISIRRKNGEIRHIKVWRKEVIWNREKHFQVINQDITELKLLNTDLILAKEKAEESNRLKTAFLHNMSHEIRTPLNGITGFIGLLQNTEIDDEARQEYFDIINKSSDRLIATVTDIIDISRIEAGEAKVSKSEVSVNEILEEQYNFFQMEAKSKGIELNYKPSLSDRESRFVTDKHKLEGIMTNLIKNAIKFTETGSITFGYAIKTLRENDVVEFYVKDTGIGIPSNRIDAIFNRFEQADIGDTRAYQGSGLGLAIAKSYVEMLGGEISVSSKKGDLPAGQAGGTTFTFSLPYTKHLVKESDAKENINKGSQTALSNLSVIIAEDDEASKMYFEAIFKNKFQNITYTTTGKETIEKFRENPDTDIVLMDIQMPDMNGYDATREIRKFNTDVVIIAQTAFGLSGDREKALEAGCDDYISKPIKKEKLFEKIRACLDKKSS